MSPKPRSTIFVKTAAVGRTSRGKYTFVTRLEAPTTLSVAEATAEEKKIQGSSPTKRKRGNGMSPVGRTCRIVEKTKLRIIIWLSGLTNAQAYPRTDCLYWPRRWRTVMCQRRSRRRHNASKWAGRSMMPADWLRGCLWAN